MHIIQCVVNRGGFGVDLDVFQHIGEVIAVHGDPVHVQQGDSLNVQIQQIAQCDHTRIVGNIQLRQRRKARDVGQLQRHISVGARLHHHPGQARVRAFRVQLGHAVEIAVGGRLGQERGQKYAFSVQFAINRNFGQRREMIQPRSREIKNGNLWHAVRQGNGKGVGAHRFINGVDQYPRTVLVQVSGHHATGKQGRGKRSPRALVHAPPKGNQALRFRVRDIFCSVLLIVVILRSPIGTAF